MLARKSFSDAEAERVAAVAESLWGIPSDGVRLPDDHREQTLHPSVRDSAVFYFRDSGIRWGTYRDDQGGRPTSLLRSSQVACVNHLEPARLDERLVIALGRALGLDPVGGLAIEGGFLTYEWIGERNYLREPSLGPSWRPLHIARRVRSDPSRGRSRARARDRMEVHRAARVPVPRRSRRTKPLGSRFTARSCSHLTAQSP